MAGEGKWQKYEYEATIRIEQTGRHGKRVTLIEKLPKNERFLKDLTVLLKNECDAAARCFVENQEGTVEVQRDQRDLIRKIFVREGIWFKA